MKLRFEDKGVFTIEKCLLLIDVEEFESYSKEIFECLG
jgi:hypothetical protein